MNTIVVTVEGVLRKLTDNSRITMAVDFLNRLTREGTGDINIIYLTSKPAADTEAWLDEQGLARDLVLGVREDRVDQLRKIRHEWGYPVSMVIEPDPSVAVDLMAEGYTTLLWLSPAYSNPEWRPDHEFAIKPWGEITRHASESARQRAADVRLKGDTL